MEEKQLLEIWEIEDRDWLQTPVSVRHLVAGLGKEVEQLRQEIQELRVAKELLEEKVNCNCDNSSMAPSTDLNKPAKKKGKEKEQPRKKRGGQPGHRGHSRPLYPAQECARLIDYYPQTCSCCGECLTGSDPNPYRHQVVEIPPIKLYIEEHRLHQLVCSYCGQKTRAVLPEEVEASGYTERVVAIQKNFRPQWGCWAVGERAASRTEKTISVMASGARWNPDPN